MTKEIIFEVLKERILEEERIEMNTFKGNLDLTSIGLDSVNAVQITADLEDKFEIDLPSDLLWELKTVDSIVAFIFAKVIA